MNRARLEPETGAKPGEKGRGGTWTEERGRRQGPVPKPGAKEETAEKGPQKEGPLDSPTHGQTPDSNQSWKAQAEQGRKPQQPRRYKEARYQKTETPQKYWKDVWTAAGAAGQAPTDR